MKPRKPKPLWGKRVSCDRKFVYFVLPDSALYPGQAKILRNWLDRYIKWAEGRRK